MKFNLFAAAICLMNFTAAASGSDSIKTAEAMQTVKVVPNSSMEAGSTHRFFFGDQWRDIWTTPVNVKVLNLEEYGGGLKPTETGGGTQTVSLRFIGKDGNEYKFRSVNKDLTSLLPEALKETFIGDIMQEQVSTANPYGSLMAVPLMDALNILHAAPELYIMPDDERLGEFREQFGGMLGTIEVHPDESEDGKNNFANSEKIAGTFKLLDRMEEDNDDYFDAAGYLKVRLLDLLIGDWDRHYDQWRWARYKEEGKKIWKPIPRDRDQAFAKFDGVFPSITEMLVPNFTSFTDSYASIDKSAFSGRHIDRRILGGMQKAEWDSVTRFTKERLTDSVIEEAVHILPDAVYKKIGKEIKYNLKSRRDNLEDISEEYYKYIFSFAEIFGSDKDEYIEINRLSNEAVKVTIYKNKNKAEDKYFEQLYDTDITGEIRIFTEKGSDKVKVTGTVERSIPVIVTSEDGDDEFIDSSKVKGDLFSIIPFIEDSEDLTEFYTGGKDNKITRGAGTEVYKFKEREYEDDEDKYERPLDYGLSIGVTGWFNLNSYDGLFIGGGPVLTKHGYLADPSVYTMIIRGGYATKPSKFRLTYEGNFYRIIRGMNLQLNLRLSGLDVVHYYGKGNQTRENRSLRENEHYQVEQAQYIFSPLVIVPIGGEFEVYGGASIEYIDNILIPGTFLELTRPYGSGDKLLYKLTGGITTDTRNHISAPDSGYFMNFRGEYSPPYKTGEAEFWKLGGEFRYYIPIPLRDRSTAAIRAGGEKLWGKYPFFESAFIGGESNLRGFERERFAGDASLYGNVEIRLAAAKLHIFIPFLTGISFTGETGRVFAAGESSDKWHSTYGAGIWTSVINRDLTFSLNFAKSVEDIQYYFNIGFAY